MFYRMKFFPTSIDVFQSNERIAYINEHRIKTYAVVVTEPKNEIAKLRETNLIRMLKIGEVKLWNRQLKAT